MPKCFDDRYTSQQIWMTERVTQKCIASLAFTFKIKEEPMQFVFSFHKILLKGDCSAKIIAKLWEVR